MTVRVAVAPAAPTASRRATSRGAVPHGEGRVGVSFAGPSLSRSGHAPPAPGVGPADHATPPPPPPSSPSGRTSSRNDGAAPVPLPPPGKRDVEARQSPSALPVSAVSPLTKSGGGYHSLRSIDQGAYGLPWSWVGKGPAKSRLRALCQGRAPFFNGLLLSPSLPTFFLY